LGIGFVFFATTAFLVLPYEPLNVLTPQTESYISFAGYFPSETQPYIDQGYVWITSKGGISADNPITLDVTLYTNSASDFTANSVYFTPLDCYDYPIHTNALGFPFARTAILGQQEQNKWVGELHVIYYKAGDFPVNITLVGFSKNNPHAQITFTGLTSEVIHISREDVTVTAKTNSLLFTLSLAFLAFSCLELTVEHNGKSADSSKQQDCQHNGIERRQTA
jgi:hypothetical protein